MKVARKIKRLGKKADRKPSSIKRKIRKPRSVGARKSHRVAQMLSKRAPQGATSLKRKATGAKRTTQSKVKARKAGIAVGRFLGKAIGNAERIINKTAETAMSILS
ncbi:MAG: hypothetical protein ACREJN_20995 [Nitrospiraceae bacterium]